MFDNPTLRFALRAALAGVASFLVAIQAQGIENLSGADYANAAIAAVLVTLGFAGVTAATPIDKTLGPGK
jgi:hypothetical protein